MNWFWLRNKRNILFLYSFPRTEEFLICESHLQKCVMELQKLGADTYASISKDILSKANDYDVIIIMAHRDDENDALAMSDGNVSIDEFVSWIPSTFSGIIDFSSCYGVKAVERIKNQCPNCLVQFFANKVHLKLKLAMYPYVVKTYKKNRKISYNEAYNQVLEAFRELIQPQENSSDETKLVDNDQHVSSIYAPQAVKKEEVFRIQVFLYPKGDEEQIELQAQRSDSKTELKETLILPITLEKGDMITAGISFLSPQKEWIQLENDKETKQCRWNGVSAHFQFAAIVNKKFKKDSFDTKIKLDINGEPQGECYFSIQIANKKNPAPADFIVRPHDYAHEQSEALERIIKKLTDAQLLLRKQIKSCTQEVECAQLEKQLHVNEVCLKYYKTGYNRNNVHGDTKYIFVSSTSDLKPYREVLRQIIQRKDKLYAEMYEKWPQKDATPRDECCRRVLESDIVMCLLGANYGSEEACWGMSMTEIEILTALTVGKPLLVFILDPLNKSTEEPPKPERQMRIIQELKKNRNLRLFSSDQCLREKANEDLYDELINLAKKRNNII